MFVVFDTQTDVNLFQSGYQNNLKGWCRNFKKNKKNKTVYKPRVKC